MKDFTQMNDSQTIDALNKEIQQKNERIDWLVKQADFMRLTLQHVTGQKNIYSDQQINCNTCG